MIVWIARRTSRCRGLFARGLRIIRLLHHLDMILDLDRIVVLHKEELMERDSPSNLLVRPSTFRELYEMSEMKREEDSSEGES
jgi:ABC-type multidrug transport system fused ATPase/permease subunit